VVVDTVVPSVVVSLLCVVVSAPFSS
jgi:hypothetical protein